MRISDWSSDVCSSDLRGPEGQVQDQQRMHRLFEPCRSGGSREPLLVPLWERLQPRALATRGKCLPARKPKTKPAPNDAGFAHPPHRRLQSRPYAIGTHPPPRHEIRRACVTEMIVTT